MATKPQEGSQYGEISSDPGRRDKTQKFDTTVGATQLTLAQNPTVNAAREAVASAVIAAHTTASRRTGLARTNESGGTVLSLEIVTNTGTVASVDQPATGGSGTGLTITTTVNTVPNPDVIGTVAVVAGGRGYVVGDIVARLSATFRVTSVS